MLLLAALLYGITAISLPAGQTVDLDGASVGLRSPSPKFPPATVALSRRGALAVLMRPEMEVTGAADKIFVVEADGTRRILRVPPDVELATTFWTYELGPHGEHRFSNASFAGIAFASDGTLFATVAHPFSGAYSGTEDAVFRLDRRRWRDVIERTTLPIDTRNITIAAAGTRSSFAVNANYTDSTADLDSLENDPHTQENEAILVNGSSTIKLGYGAATALRDRYVVGYTNGDRLVVISGEPAKRSTALEWTDGQRRALGPGIAYGVNSQGDVVGNSGPDLAREGAPTLWQAGRRIRLSNAPGSAFAIGDDGTVIGAINNSAFLVRGSDSSHKILRIDQLLGRSRWHVNAAYAIAADGRILATGRREHGPLKILLLDPK